jgi:hypothetical protein
MLACISQPTVVVVEAGGDGADDLPPPTPRGGLRRALLSQSSLVPRDAELLINTACASPHSPAAAPPAFQRLPSMRRALSQPSLLAVAAAAAAAAAAGPTVEAGPASSGGLGDLDAAMALAQGRDEDEDQDEADGAGSGAGASGLGGGAGADAMDEDDASDASSLPQLRRENSTLHWTPSRRCLEENLEAAAARSLAHPEPDMKASEERLAERLAALGLVVEEADGDGARRGGACVGGLRQQSARLGSPQPGGKQLSWRKAAFMSPHPPLLPPPSPPALPPSSRQLPVPLHQPAAVRDAGLPPPAARARRRAHAVRGGAGAGAARGGRLSTAANAPPKRRARRPPPASRWCKTLPSRAPVSANQPSSSSFFPSAQGQCCVL